MLEKLISCFKPLMVVHYLKFPMVDYVGLFINTRYPRRPFKRNSSVCLYGIILEKRGLKPATFCYKKNTFFCNEVDYYLVNKGQLDEIISIIKENGMNINGKLIFPSEIKETLLKINDYNALFSAKGLSYAQKNIS